MELKFTVHVKAPELEQAINGNMIQLDRIAQWMAQVNTKLGAMVSAIKESSRTTAAILNRLDELKQGEQIIMSDLSQITDAVSKIEDQATAAETALQMLAQQISDLKTDPVALQGLADSLTTKAAELGQAIATYTTPTG